MFQPGNSGLHQVNAHQAPCVLSFLSFFFVYITKRVLETKGEREKKV